jgi:hypothetical protein
VKKSALILKTNDPKERLKKLRAKQNARIASLGHTDEDSADEPYPEEAYSQENVVLKTSSALSKIAGFGTAALADIVKREIDSRMVTKTAKKKRQGYLSQMIALTPAAGVKALADLPKGSIEKAIESKVRGQKTSFKGVASRGIGRWAGASAGLISLPMFVSGVKDLKSRNKKRRRKGWAKVLGSGAVYSYGKGGIESLVERGASLKSFAKGGTGRFLVSIPATAAAGYAIAKGLKKPSSRKRAYLLGALAGGIGGLSKGVGEAIYHESALRKTAPKAFRKALIGKGLGRAAAGVIGGTALAAIFDKMIKKKGRFKKKIAHLIKVGEGARAGFSPYPHQARAIERLLENEGTLIMAHGTGSGKTATSLFGFEKLREIGKGKNALVVVPASLRQNYVKNIQKFTTSSYQVVGPKGEKGSVYFNTVDPNKTYTIVSYSMFRRAPQKLAQLVGADTLIFDEYHRAKDPAGRTYRAAMKARAVTQNFMGLTGSVINNDPIEIVPLISIASRGKTMSPREFKTRYQRKYARVQGFFGGRKYLTTMVNLSDAKKRLGPYVDYMSTEQVGKSMPRREVEEIHVPMSDQQRDIYEWTLKKVGPITAYKIRNNLPVDQKEAFHIFSMVSKARQAANSVQPFVKGMTLKNAAEKTPKVKRLLDDTTRHLSEVNDAQIVIYSNLIRGGVDVLSAGLTSRGIEHALFIGKGREVGGKKVTGKSREKGVKNFLAGKTKVIVLSGAGAEGLDLKNATLFQSLDGHFNPERTRQAEARARRMGGLSHRPQEQRVIKVRRYFSSYPDKGFFSRLFTGSKKSSTTDMWVHTVAKRKHNLNEMLRSALRQSPAVHVPTEKKAPVMVPASAPEPRKFKATVQELSKPKRIPKFTRKWKDPITGEWRYAYAKTRGPRGI